MITEDDIMRTVQAGQLTFPPLALEWINRPANPILSKSDVSPDLLLRVRWGEHVFEFGADVKVRYTKQAIEQATATTLRYTSQHSGTYPMVIVPYLNENSLRRLEEQAVSAIDLCGNGVIVVPDKLLLLRTGYPNKYPSSEPIKNIYNGVSSLVARVLLSRSEYPSVEAVQAEIARRGGTVALSTISRVLSALEADLIIGRDMVVGRDRGTVRLLQPEKLIDNLAANYRNFAISRRFQARYLTGEANVMEALVRNVEANHKRHALTGLNSVNLYAAMSPADRISLYCTDIDGLLPPRGEEPVLIEETARFPDIEIFETQEEAAYFDTRRENLPSLMTLYRAASPIQTYLELMTRGPREKQTAEQVKQYILDAVGKQ